MAEPRKAVKKAKKAVKAVKATSKPVKKAVKKAVPVKAAKKPPSVFREEFLDKKYDVVAHFPTTFLSHHVTAKHGEAVEKRIAKVHVESNFYSPSARLQVQRSHPVPRIVRNIYTFDIPTGILPVAVRYISPSRNAFIIERPPRIARIDFISKNKQQIKGNLPKITTTYHIPLPWTLTVLKFVNYHTRLVPYPSLGTINIYCTPGPIGIDDYDHPVSIMPLPNNMQSFPCLEDTGAQDTLADLFAQKDVTVARVINRLINLPWEGRFNNDAGRVCWSHILPTVLTNKLELDADVMKTGTEIFWDRLLAAWQELSLEDVIGWDASGRGSLAWSADTNSATLGNIIKHLDYSSIQYTSGDNPTVFNMYNVIKGAFH